MPRRSEVHQAIKDALQALLNAGLCHDDGGDGGCDGDGTLVVFDDINVLTDRTDRIVTELVDDPRLEVDASPSTGPSWPNGTTVR